MSDKITHPSIYEINTRVWLNRFNTKRVATLNDVPQAYWKYLKELGMDYVWLMGVWKTNEVDYDRAHLTDEQRANYKQTLSDFTTDDLIGSPYAIDCYEINPRIGTLEEFKLCREQLNKLGLRLILDFVPNHFGKHSRLLSSNPDLFLDGNEQDLFNYPQLFFRSSFDNDRVFAHGKDPYFGPWNDTVQVDYSKRITREFMADQLLKIAGLCDGVRCDMAMMILKEIFYDSWSNIKAGIQIENWTNEFWEDVIKAVKSKYPNFIFIAESYWEKEAELQYLGFDYTYDKEYTDRILSGDIAGLKDKLHGNRHFQNRLVRFLENHDEKRSLHEMHSRKNFAAASLLAVSPGMNLYYDGQWEGKRTYTSVHLGRSALESFCQCPIRANLSYQQVDPNFYDAQLIAAEIHSPWQKRYPIEPVCSCTYQFYQKLLQIVNSSTFKNGNWTLIPIQPADNETSSDLIIGIQWSTAEETWVTLINLSAFFTEGVFSTIRTEDMLSHSIHWIDHLNDQKIAINRQDESTIITRVQLHPYSARLMRLEKDIK